MKNFLILTILVIILSGCSVTKTVYVKNMKGSNLNHNGDDVPVTIIFYKLKDITKFQETSPIDLINREDAVLGKDKIDSSKMQIAPENEMKITQVTKKEARYVGLLVIYNDIKDKKLKSALFTKKIKGKNLIFIISDKGVFIDGIKNRSRELIDGK